jgi:hypothetical protein
MTGRIWLYLGLTMVMFFTFSATFWALEQEEPRPLGFPFCVMALTGGLFGIGLKAGLGLNK